MKISEVERKEAKSKLFEGQTERQAFVDEEMSKLLRVNLIHFHPGAKNVFHTHSADQVLVVTEGRGIIASETEEITVDPGTVIFIPAGERHWHGATPQDSFSHFSIVPPGETKY